MRDIRPGRIRTNQMHSPVGAAISRQKAITSEYPIARIPSVRNQKSLLLLEKVPAAAGECGGDPFRKCRSWYEGKTSNPENLPRRFKPSKADPQGVPSTSGPSTGPPSPAGEGLGLSRQSIRIRPSLLFHSSVLPLHQSGLRPDCITFYGIAATGSYGVSNSLRDAPPGGEAPGGEAF